MPPLKVVLGKGLFPIFLLVSFSDLSVVHGLWQHNSSLHMVFSLCAYLYVQISSKDASYVGLRAQSTPV